MKTWENLCIQVYQQQGKLIAEQQTHEHSPLYELALPPPCQTREYATEHDTSRYDTEAHK